jgi:hypothetical protein
MSKRGFVSVCGWGNRLFIAPSQHLPQISPTRCSDQYVPIKPKPKPTRKTQNKNSPNALSAYWPLEEKRRSCVFPQETERRELLRCGMRRRFSYASRRTPRFLTFRDEAASTTEPTATDASRNNYIHSLSLSLALQLPIHWSQVEAWSRHVELSSLYYKDLALHCGGNKWCSLPEWERKNEKRSRKYHLVQTAKDDATREKNQTLPQVFCLESFVVLRCLIYFK